MINFTLNDKPSYFEAENDETLLSLLRRNGLFSAKKGCKQGKCGFCTVLLNEEPVPSCIIPVGIIRNSSVQTFEHFSTANKTYTTIMAAFDTVGVQLCGYCNAARILSIYDLLKKKISPSDEEISEFADNFFCNCIDKDSFKKVIKIAAENYMETEGRR